MGEFFLVGQTARMPYQLAMAEFFEPVTITPHEDGTASILVLSKLSEDLFLVLQENKINCSPPTGAVFSGPGEKSQKQAVDEIKTYVSEAVLTPIVEAWKKQLGFI